MAEKLLIWRLEVCLNKNDILSRFPHSIFKQQSVAICRPLTVKSYAALRIAQYIWQGFVPNGAFFSTRRLN
jgi:hypothetical protein